MLNLCPKATQKKSWKKKQSTLQVWKPQPSPASTHDSHKGSAMNLHIKGHPPSLCHSLTTRPDWPTWAYCTGLLILPSSSLLAGILGCHHNCDPDSGGGCYKGGPLCRPSVHMSLDFWLYVLCLVWVASLVLLSLGFHICKNKAPVDGQDVKFKLDSVMAHCWLQSSLSGVWGVSLSLGKSMGNSSCRKQCLMES